jgi:hypothetical protein
LTDEKAKAIAFMGECIDRKLVLAILSFDLNRFVVLVRIKQILQNLD